MVTPCKTRGIRRQAPPFIGIDLSNNWLHAHYLLDNSFDQLQSFNSRILL